jgi:hypothetical protein
MPWRNKCAIRESFPMAIVCHGAEELTEIHQKKVCVWGRQREKATRTEMLCKEQQRAK